MLIVYKKLTKKEIQKAREELLNKATNFFVTNPKRRVCNAGYLRGIIVDDVMAADLK